MAEKTNGPNLPFIKKKQKNGKSYVHWLGKEFGPWDWAGKLEFTRDQRSWQVRAKRGDKLYLVTDGVAHGPFDRFGRERWFSQCHKAFACTVICGREVFLIENGRMESKGEIVEKDGATFLAISGHGYGPYRKVTDLLFSPGGGHWTADVEKQGRWHGFVVDGVEYGPYPKQFFGARFSPDGNRWFVALDRGRENSVCSFILDSKKYGRSRIMEMCFLGDNRFLYAHLRRGSHLFVLDGREIGPFIYDGKDFDLIGDDIWVVRGFVKKGREKPLRRLIYLWIAEKDKRVFFSANGGETLDDAIEVINADDTGTGVWAEHQYMKLLLADQGLAGEFVEQRLIKGKRRHYDQLIFREKNGKEHALFFDITSFWGKSNEAGGA